MDTTNRKGMEKLYLKRLFILLFLFPASLWAQDALSEILSGARTQKPSMKL